MSIRQEKISIILIVFILFSFKAFSQFDIDSLKESADKQFVGINGDSEERITTFLETVSKINRIEPTEALFYINGLESKLNRLNSSTAKGLILLNKGNFYWSVGIYNIALKTFFEALRWYESTNNTDQIIRILNNIGETYKKQQNYAKAEEFLKRALDLNKTESDEKFLLIKVNVAQLKLLNKQYKEANEILMEIIQLPINENDWNTHAFAYLYKGIIHKEYKEFDSAKLFLNKSLDLWKRNNLNRYTAETLAELADISFLQNQHSQAREYLHQAEQKAQSSKALDILMRVYQYQIELIENSRGEDSLGYYYKKYVAIKDSIYNEESRKEINKLTVQYDLSEKEKEYYKLALEQNILENDNSRQKAILIVLALILILVVVFSVLQIRKRYQLSHAHQELQLQKEEIEKTQKQVSAKSLELAKLNQELYNLNRNLEQKVVERSQQLNLKNKQIAEYTFYNSHKLRAPVASILGLINVMELNKEGKIDNYLIDHLKTSALELDNVIHKLKNLLDIEMLEEIEKDNN